MSRLEFVKLRPVVVRVLSGEQALIVEHGWGESAGTAAWLRDRSSLRRRKTRGDTLGDRQGRVVEADPAILA